MKIKRESPHFAAWDARGMAAHLEAMEAKGWQFRGVDWLGRWEYEPCEPKSVRYAIAYAPSRRNWILKPTEAERDLEDLCFDAGWRKMAALNRFHIYRNADPNATELETDELTRLNTLDRSLGRSKLPLLALYVLVCGYSLYQIGRGLASDLPRVLSIPALVFAILLALWLMLTETVQDGMYHFWLRAARKAAQSGTPCPEVKHWRLWSGLRNAVLIFLLICMLTGVTVKLMLLYAAAYGCFYALRWFLEHKVQNELLAENTFQVSLIVLCIVLGGINMWYQSALREDSETDVLPLMAQDLMDTSEMELQQFAYDTNDSFLASYSNYWQSDSLGPFDLQYTIFDLRFSPLEKACTEWFLEDFAAIAERKYAEVSEADAALWNAEQVLYFPKNGEDHWLIFYSGRTVELFTSWSMTDTEIAAAAEQLAP